nr:Gmad2 immunoglobulin-like domain-containing protein [Motilibacter aurantiacus]
MVEPSGNGLERIRERTGRPWWRSPAAAVSTAVVAVLAAGAVGIGIGTLAGNDGDDRNEPAADPINATGPVEVTTQPALPPAPASPAPTPEESTPAPSDGAVPVYFVKDDGDTPRLYREFHRVRASSGDGALVRAALQEMAGEPADPDYRSLWAGMAVASYERSGGTATVTFDAAGREPAAEEDGDPIDVAVQQVVYTVTAVEQDAALAVTVVVDGQEVAAGATRGEESDVAGLVWLTSPEQGATVSGQVRLEGVASVFEATVGWEARQGGEVVESGFATATEAGPGRGTWSATVELPAGRYELRAFAPDESGLEGEGVLGEDTKEVVVR